MKPKQLGALFIIQVAFNSVGGALGALLPVFAGRLGADASAVGLLFAIAFGGVAAGVLFSGWLAHRWPNRKAILIGVGFIEVGIMFASGQSTTMIQLTVLTTMWTFCGGVVISMANTLAGLSAGEAERGRVFGILASTGGIGGLIGGLVSGPVVDRWGFGGLFLVAAMMYAAAPIAGLFLENKTVAQLPGHAASAARAAVWSRGFIFLVLATIAAFAVNGMQSLARSLLMDYQHFLAADITSTVSVAGLVSIPFPFVLGWLSDRVGRKPLIIAGYLATAACVLVLAASTSLWHFWLSGALAALTGASFAVGLALVADLVPAERLGTALAVFSATNWIGLIIGSELTGVAIQSLGMTPALLLGGLVGAVSVALVALIRRPGPVVLAVPVVEAA